MGKLTAVESDAIVAAGYDEHTGVLIVRFRDGGTYEYLEAPRSLFEELLAAQPHPWSAVGRRVMSHDYRRLD